MTKNACSLGVLPENVAEPKTLADLHVLLIAVGVGLRRVEKGLTGPRADLIEKLRNKLDLALEQAEADDSRIKELEAALAKRQAGPSASALRLG